MYTTKESDALFPIFHLAVPLDVNPIAASFPTPPILSTASLAFETALVVPTLTLPPLSIRIRSDNALPVAPEVLVEKTKSAAKFPSFSELILAPTGCVCE